MQFDKNKFSLAAALTTGILYLACAVFTAFWPVAALKLSGWMFHVVNVEKFAGDVAIRPGGVVFGLIGVVIYIYIAAWIFAWLYNQFTKPTP